MAGAVIVGTRVGAAAAGARRITGRSSLMSARTGERGEQVISGGHLGPHEPGEFAGDGGDDDFAVGFAGVETVELAAEPLLGGPGASNDGRVEPLLASFDGRAGSWPRFVGPRRFDELGAQAGVAGVGDTTAADTLARGMFRRGQPAEPHEQRRGRKPSPVTHLGVAKVNAPSSVMPR